MRYVESRTSSGSSIVALFLRSSLGVVIAPAILLAQPARVDSSLLAYTQQFSYDASLPLNVRSFERVDSATFVREKIVFDGWRGSRVPGFVAVPKSSGVKHPVVVLVDGIGGWKERWWQPASWNRGKLLIDSLIASGFAVVMVDAPASGERTFENDYESAESFIRKPAQWRDMGIQNVIEIRRLLDYLATRTDVDTSRIGVLGLSHGGMMTFILGAVEPRIRAAVAGLTPMQNIPDALMPSHYAPSVRIPTLLLAGRTDGWYTQPQAERALAALASREKELVWYDVGHRLPESYAGAAARWFREHLR